MTSRIDKRQTDEQPAVVEQPPLQSAPFMLRDGSFAGDGVQVSINLDDWANVFTLVRADGTRDIQ